jgi:hypothetical protein
VDGVSLRWHVWFGVDKYNEGCQRSVDCLPPCTCVGYNVLYIPAGRRSRCTNSVLTVYNVKRKNFEQQFSADRDLVLKINMA